MASHIRHVEPTYGAIPLCGRAMWDVLVTDPNQADCWECRSIAGLGEKGAANEDLQPLRDRP